MFYAVTAIVVVAFLAFIVAIALRRVVPTNMVHIVQSSKATTPYGRDKPAGNTYYAWPAWLPVLGVSVIEFPESIFQVELKDYDAYDMARLPFVVDTAAFFRVEEAEKVAQRVSSFEELTSQLRAVLQGAVRRVLATNKLEEIMQSRSELGNQFTDEVREQLKEWGVLPVKTIEFMDLRDAAGSQVIANVMEKEKSRIDKESRVQVASNTREAELAEIDAQRVVDVQREDAAEQVGLRKAEKDKVVGKANEQAQQEIKAEAKTTAEREMDVKKVTEVRGAEIVREVQVVQADTEKRTSVTKAQGALEASKLDAEGVRARGEADASAQQAMLMAPVETQIKLAKEIGNNQGYQSYLITIEQVRAGEKVGVQMAQALAQADVKVLANNGDVAGGVAKAADMFSPAGGNRLSGMLMALGQTEEGAKLLESLTSGTANPALKAMAAGAVVSSASPAGVAAGVTALLEGDKKD